MRYEFSGLSLVQKTGHPNRYSFSIKKDALEMVQPAYALNSFLSLQEEILHAFEKLYVTEKKEGKKIKYQTHWALDKKEDRVFMDFSLGIQMMMKELIDLKHVDLHDLCSFKMDQLPNVFSHNDLRMELMTKQFQPHLILIYPILSTTAKEKFFFGSSADSWMFDPLIDALSYRRAGQKATLLFFIAHSQVGEVHLYSGDQESDTVKILKEAVRSGLQILTPKISSQDPNFFDISFQDRFFLS